MSHWLSFECFKTAAFKSVENFGGIFFESFESFAICKGRFIHKGRDCSTDHLRANHLHTVNGARAERGTATESNSTD